jgi:hypothetical protein
MSHLSSVQLLWILTWLAVLGVCGYALFRGARPERICAVVILVSAFLYQFTIYVPAEYHGSVVMVMDGAAAIGFLILAVCYANLWLGGVMVMQAAQFWLHAAYVLLERRLDARFSEINNGIVFVQMACLLVGVIVSQRRRKQVTTSLTGAGAQPPTP